MGRESENENGSEGGDLSFWDVHQLAIRFCMSQVIVNFGTYVFPSS